MSYYRIVVRPAAGGPTERKPGDACGAYCEHTRCGFPTAPLTVATSSDPAEARALRAFFRTRLRGNRCTGGHEVVVLPEHPYDGTGSDVLP